MKNALETMRSKGRYGRLATPVVFLLLGASLQAQARWYVNADAVGHQDGSSWQDAFRSPNTALALAVLGDEVWVKAGRYTTGGTLTSRDPRSATFKVPVGVLFCGGFNGTEASLVKREGLFAETILTGDLGQLGDISDNAYHVVTAVNTSGTPAGFTSIDGFTIQDGYANGPANSSGAGVLMFNSALKLANCTLRNNRAMRGAGLQAQPGFALVRWCNFVDNHATNTGGAVWGQAINFKLSHCSFSDNTADRGGAVYFSSIAESPPGHLPVVLLHNSLFHDNRARLGGAIFLGGGPYSSGKATFSNCTIAYNRALEGGGSWAATDELIPAQARFHNSIVWHNAARQDPNLAGRHEALFSNIENGACDGYGNLSLDPLFVAGESRDLRLASLSPSIDMGNNMLVPLDFTDSNTNGLSNESQVFDLLHAPRFSGELSVFPDPFTVDMGAYER